MAKDDWYRLPALAKSEVQFFEEKLARSRSSRHEYMRIQAGALYKSGHSRRSLEMIERIFAEDGGVWTKTWLLENVGDCQLALGNFNEACTSFRAALASQREHPGLRGNAEISLALAVIEAHSLPLYQEALDYVLEFNDGSTLFPREAFVRHSVIAVLSDGLKDKEGAIANARAALGWAGRDESNAANHRKLGLVDGNDWPLLKRVKKIAEADKSLSASNLIRNALRKLKN